MNKDLKSFLEREKVGLILRVYAEEESQIPRRLQMVREFVDRALSVKHNGRTIISQINILVWADKNYPESDCGKTADGLKAIFPHAKGNKVFINTVEHGDLYCGLLNYGLTLQTQAHVHYSIIASAEAYSYFNEETLMAMVEAAKKGALAIGIALNKLTESILEGRLANTFAMWHNLSLLSVGGFDLHAAKPIDPQKADYKIGWDEDEGEIHYHTAGVEEIIPLIRLVKYFGQCLAPILPQGKGVQRYIVPTEPGLHKRHMAKMLTKTERQTAHANWLGFSLTYLKGGILPEYRK